jgi:hypothetical protein
MTPTEKTVYTKMISAMEEAAYYRWLVGYAIGTLEALSHYEQPDPTVLSRALKNLKGAGGEQTETT